MINRRELIAAFLGTAVASSCKRSAAPRAQVPGSLVDRVVETGHLLRSEKPLPIAARAEPLDVLIIGAGAAGLSAAWRLSAAGVTGFKVIEVDAEIGGTARSGRNEVSAFPWGAHYLPAPLYDQGPVVRLLRELGAVTSVDDKGRPHYAEEMLVREPDERLFYKGTWYEGLYLRAGASAKDLEELKRFETKMDAFGRARDAKGRKAFAVPLSSGSDDAEFTSLDKLSMAEWLSREGFSSPRLRWMVDYACRDDYGAPADLISAYAGIWYFAARNEGQGERSEGYLSWPEGNGRLIRQLRESAGSERLLTGVLAHTVIPEQDGVTVHALEKGAPRSFRARQVVLAVPRFVAAHVVAPWRTERPAFLSAFQYTPWVVANLTLRERPTSRGFPLCWDNVFYESQSLGYVVATHQAQVASEVGPTVFTWYYPLAGADVKKERERLLSAKYDEWEQLVVADLSVAHPKIDQLATRLEVMRWGHAMIRPAPGFLFGGAREQAITPLGPLHFAHSDLGGLALFEEANHHGVRAAEAALLGLGREQQSWL